MHTLQLLLVEASTPDEAKAKVAADGQAPWSDWSEIDAGSLSYAGRWSNDNRLGPKSEFDVLRYSDDPETADNQISKMLLGRQLEIEATRNNLYRIDKNILFSYNYNATEEKSWDEREPLYFASSLTDLLLDRWCSNSYVYDLEDSTANLTDFYKRVDANPDEQFLVLVDFHC